MIENPRLFEQGDRFDDEGNEARCRDLWTRITLRDLYVMAALPAVVRDSFERNGNALEMNLPNIHERLIAQTAIKIADALLAERVLRKENE